MTASLRPFREGDEPACVALQNALSRALYGVDETSEDEFRTYLTMPTVDPARDIRLAEDGGALVGYADVFDQNAWHTRYWSDVRVDPTRGDAALADALVAWGEERARADATDGAFLRSYVAEGAEPVRKALEARGYTVVRSSYRMLRELDGVPEAPEWPDGVTVRTMRAGEEGAVYEAHEECFADHWEHVREPFEEFLHWTVGRETFDPGLAFLALDGDVIAGYALCERSGADPDEGWVGILGVRRRWRRRGLGRALLLHAFGEFHRRGWKRAGLDVDADSLTGAVRLYERAGMHVERRSDCYHREL